MKRAIAFPIILLGALSAGCVENSKPQADSPNPTSHTDDATGKSPRAAVLTLDETNFGEVVLKSDKPVLVDVWATWCKPCKMIAPIVEEIAQEYSGRAVVAKLDFDSARGTAGRYQVEFLPTLLIFKDGKEVSRVEGVQGKQVIVNQLNAALNL